MNVSIVTFANLGKKTNLKTSDILPVIHTFSENEKLSQIICLIDTDFYFKNTVSAIPVWIRYSLRVLEKIFRFSFSRNFTEILFDTFAKNRLQKSELVIFHPGYFLSKTVAKAKNNGSIVIDLAVSAHIRTNADLEKFELPFLNSADYKGMYTDLDSEYKNTNEFNYVIALSEFVKESYVQKGFPIENIFVAVPDIDVQRFSPKLNFYAKRPFNILYVAHTQPLKGLHYLLDAWKNFKDADATLTIVGGFAAMPETLKQKYMSQIESDERITYIADTQEPEKYYHDASLLVFPSLTEGFGRVTLEAMACGIPVITTENARGIVEDGKTGFVVPIRSAEQIREKIEFLYHNPEIREQMGREARKAVEQKKPFGEAVYEIYQEILKREQKHPSI